MLFHIEHKISARERSIVLHLSRNVSLTVVRDTVAVSSSEVSVGSSDSVLTTSDAMPPAYRTSRTTVTSSTVIPVTHHIVTETTSSMVKLPKLEPKTFNGDLTKWETFWNSFESSILHYLL